ncbi:hypothetical protein MHU86_19387 [Fragilaria crotonensis]|nr:hypothetical protein MHU86_19387 [Fragilaria crotonensis]
MSEAMENRTPCRSVLTSYVRNLQQKPLTGDESERVASLSTRKLRSTRDDNQFVSVLKSKRIIVAREKELQQLRDCYDDVATMKTTAVVTIHGPPGVGKTALAHFFIHSLPEGAFHMEGKFNQLQLRAPYAALAAACDQLCHQIMRRQNSIEIRDKIRAVLGPDINLLGNVVQTLSEMTAKDGSSGRHTGASGAQMFTRFKLMFRAFLRCVASPETPLVFFLDDLQWADVPSLEVLKTLLTNGESHCIMIMCSYREEGMTAEQLEEYNLAECRSMDAEDSAVSRLLSTDSSGISDITIAGLGRNSFNQLISETLGIDSLLTQSLSTVLWNKTDGNPFHALNFLDMLHRNGMLWRGNDGTWTWDTDRILRETNVTENLVDILALRMRDLPEQVRSIVQIASFVGNDFPADALVMIVHEEQDMVEATYSFERHSKEVIRDRIAFALNMAVDAGLLETMPDPDHFKFAHDKIQEVLYETLMPDEMERQLLHQRIGTLIWDSVKNAGVYSRSSVLVKEIQVRATSAYDHAIAGAVEMASVSLQGDLKGSVILGLKVLRQLGVKFPRRIDKLVIATEMVRVKALMGRRSLHELLFLPEMTDKTIILAFSLMNAMAIDCYLLGGLYKGMYAMLSLRVFRLTLMFGISPLHSPGAFVAWGSMHAFLGKFDIALQAEQLAFAVVNKYEAESVRGSALIASYSMNHFWRNVLDSSSRREFLNAYYLAMSYGHVVIAQNGFVAWVAANLYLDDFLEELNSTTRRVVQEMREFQTSRALMFLLPVWQVFLNICGDSRNTNPAILKGEAVDDEFEREVYRMDSKVAVINVSRCQMFMGFVYDDLQVIKIHLPIVEKYKKEVEGYFTTGFMFTWCAVCNYDLYLATGISHYKRDGRRGHRRVEKWATTGTTMLVGPSTFLQAMEGLCVKKLPPDQVEILFEKAASACAATRCRYFEALSIERLARYFRREAPNKTKYSLYQKKAAELFRSWGAAAKADWLEKGDNDHTPPCELGVVRIRRQ